MPLDIGAGILLSLWVAKEYSFAATPLFIATGIVFALLPDIDIFWYLLGTPAAKHDHRSFTHYPLIYIPLALVIYIFFGAPYAALFAACITLHFIHDTMGLGWGVAWLAPLSYRKIRFLSPTGSSSGSWEFFRTWTPQEEAVLAKRQHDPHWVKRYYLEPNIIGAIEYATLLAAIVSLYIYFS